MPTRIEDLLDLDTLLTPEDIELRQTVRRFGEQRLRPHIAEWFEAGEVPVRELAADLGKLGVLGMHLQGYGCGGSTATAYGLVCQELEAVDSGLRSLVSVQGSLAMFAIYRWGSEEQRNQWLPAMATGDVDLNWAREHHDVWLEEQLSRERLSARSGQSSAAPAE